MSTTPPAIDNRLLPKPGVGLWEYLCRIIKVILGKRPGQRGCIYIPERIINRPDPCIYDQYLLMALGLPVTWDNPDFAILLGGIKQYTYNLTVNTTYDLVITVHNSSRKKPALGTQVNVVWMEFGAGGTTFHPLANLVTDVPVWPGTSQVHVPWTTPATAGHYCLQARLFHPNDGNPANNLGQNNTQVYAAHSQVQRQIRIFNRFPAQLSALAVGRSRSHVDITVDSYVFQDAIGKDANPDVMFAPRPAVWPASVTPASFDFAPDEEFRDVTLTVDAPNGPGPAEPFNVNVRQDGVPSGGVTILIERK